jgi:hypothetical protein
VGSLAHLASNGKSCGGPATASHLTSFAPPGPQLWGPCRGVVLVRREQTPFLSVQPKVNGEPNAPHGRTMKHFMRVDRARTSWGPVRLAALPLARSLSEREGDMSRAIPSHSTLILLSAFSSRACVISTVQLPPFAKYLICQPRSSSTLYFFSDP